MQTSIWNLPILLKNLESALSGTFMKSNKFSQMKNRYSANFEIINLLKWGNVIINYKTLEFYQVIILKLFFLFRFVLKHPIRHHPRHFWSTFHHESVFHFLFAQFGVYAWKLFNQFMVIVRRNPRILSAVIKFQPMHIFPDIFLIDFLYHNHFVQSKMPNLINHTRLSVLYCTPKELFGRRTHPEINLHD